MVIIVNGVLWSLKLEREAGNHIWMTFGWSRTSDTSTNHIILIKILKSTKWPNLVWIFHNFLTFMFHKICSLSHEHPVKIIGFYPVGRLPLVCISIQLLFNSMYSPPISNWIWHHPVRNLHTVSFELTILFPAISQMTMNSSSHSPVSETTSKNNSPPQLSCVIILFRL